MSTSMRTGIVFILFLFLSFHALSQVDKTNVESIKAYVQKLSSDTEKINTLIELSFGIDCIDSLNKLALVTEAKKIAVKISWPKGIVSSNRTLGNIYFTCQKDYTRAFEYYRMNVEYAKSRNDKLGLAYAYENIAKQYGVINDHKKSIEYYTDELALKPGVSLEAAVYGNIGISYKAIGDYGSAIRYYDSSLNLIKSKQKKDAQDTVEMGAVYLNTGEVFLLTSQTDNALVQFKNVLGIGTDRIDKNFLIWSLAGIGKTYKVKKEYAKAIEYYRQALAACVMINSFVDEVNMFGELANTYMETWELDKALAYADSSLSLAETQHFINRLSYCNTTLGNIYIRQDKPDLAIVYLHKALEIARQTNNLLDMKDAWEGLHKAYAKGGQWQLAYDARGNLYAIKDSVFNIERANDVLRVQMNSDAKIKLGIEQHKLAEEYGRKSERQKVLTYSGFGGLILVVLLAFFMYRNYKTQKKYNELLSREKMSHLAHIEAQSNILSDIAHTQAHQVRGPISTILGLVHIFNYDDPTDPMNKQVMEWITSTTEKLDAAVKDVIIKENQLRSEHDHPGEPPATE